MQVGLEPLAWIHPEPFRFHTVLGSESPAGCGSEGQAGAEVLPFQAAPGAIAAAALRTQARAGPGRQCFSTWLPTGHHLVGDILRPGPLIPEILTPVV